VKSSLATGAQHTSREPLEMSPGYCPWNNAFSAGVVSVGEFQPPLAAHRLEPRVIRRRGAKLAQGHDSAACGARCLRTAAQSPI
jgi:hypothetical protein